MKRIETQYWRICGRRDAPGFEPKIAGLTIPVVRARSRLTTLERLSHEKAARAWKMKVSKESDLAPGSAGKRLRRGGDAAGWQRRGRILSEALPKHQRRGLARLHHRHRSGARSVAHQVVEGDLPRNTTRRPMTQPAIHRGGLQARKSLKLYRNHKSREDRYEYRQLYLGTGRCPQPQKHSESEIWKLGWLGRRLSQNNSSDSEYSILGGSAETLG